MAGQITVSGGNVYMSNGFASSANWLQMTPASRTISTTSPLAGGGALTGNLTLSIANAAANGTTKGAATFRAADFNDDGAGLISLDTVNGPYNTRTQAAAAFWSKSGDPVTSGQFMGSTNNAEVMIKANNDTVIRVLPTGQVGIWSDIPNGLSSFFIRNGAAPNGVMTNSMFSIFKPSLGGATNSHIAGTLLFPSNAWTSISDGPVWFYGFAPTEKSGYLTFAGRDENTNFFPYLTVNKKYLLGVGRTGTTTGIDATAMLHVAPGLDTVAPLKLTTGFMLTAPEKGAFEYAANTLWFSRDAGRNKFLFDGYTDTITVSASGGDYTTISALFAAESAGIN